ncbi:hypothetical protein SAMN05216480_10759 [Pustulibacterium marinum]|uniref:Adhesin n=1 Tax=Pustulibacterium marinum TaxID=1224947 RepID=A0A1I7H5B1_9FLAO|nr:hypothetical protein [Pustulibacterium marinum]SFU55706.1 hypothetical protein SAMN05216480_10759 [Pustulibacterium marinum]
MLAFIQISFASTPKEKNFNGKYTKEKTIKREFMVSSSALLKINNSYGNLNITSWNENKTAIEVHIKTNGNNEQKVIDKLNDINIIFDANENLVSAKTIFDENGWSWGWKNNNVNVEVNYVIKLPVNNQVDLSNDYGGIYLNKLNGKAKISCDYGKLEIGELWGSNNELNCDYTTDSHIGIFKDGNINADYSDLTIEKTKNLYLNADYTKTKIEKADKVEYNCDYGSLTVGDVMNFSGNGDYLSLRIDSVYGKVSIRSDYGSIKIRELSVKTEGVEIRSSYTGISMGYHPDFAFNFDISLDYAGLTGKEDLNFTLKDSDYTSHKYQGYYKYQNTGKTIYIRSDYGGVNLTKL